MTLEKLADLLQSPAASHWVAGCHLLHLPGRQPPWQDTDLRLESGQGYSVFARGQLQWSRRQPSLHGGPRFHLWTRTSPHGEICNLRAAEDTFAADADGVLEVGIYMGLWKNARGELATGPEWYDRLEGAIDALVVTWRAPALEAMAALLSLSPDPLLARARARLQHPVETPVGWRYLTEAGHAECYHAGEQDGRPCIDIRGEDDQGILVREVDFPLTADSRITWRWRVDQHPSRLPEDSPATHDYLSVACEFDDGRDLTWIWSSALPVNRHFACPVKAWSEREWHYVVRSGEADFGQWLQEERAVANDVRVAIGTAPGRIVRVWLIVVASFQHGRFDASVADIELRNGSQTLRVL